MLEKPGLAESLIAFAQVKPDIGRARGRSLEVEHCPPNVRINDRINRFAFDDAEGAVTTSSISPRLENWLSSAPEIHDVFHGAFRTDSARYPTDAKPRSDNAGQRRRIGLVRRQ